MKIVIPNPFAAHDTTVPGQSPIISDQDLLFNTLREASAHASQQQRTVLASYTQPIERYDTIQAFNGARQAGLGECFFWEQPAEQNTLVGIGATTAIETMGSTCFIDSASAWRSLLNHAVITSTPSTLPTPGSGPVLFGGFAFDPLSPRTQLWADFPAGLLILPHFLLSYTANQVTLTINHLIQPFENIERCVWEIESGVRQLHAAIEQTRTIPTEETSNKFSIHEQRSASEWMATVANTVDNIQHGAFEKVVLARDIQVKLDDEKNNDEHAIVVAMVWEALKNHCTSVHTSAAPQLLKLKNLQHLMTPFAGELISGRCILDVLADLHPTPAVGGFPRHAALAAIRETEKLDRGWYAGPLGWIGANGHGEFAVALRSGLIDGGQATLFAGCGIVSSSDPQAEYAESNLKFQVMLRGLGGSK